jgi:ribosomal-protein-alanine N-acetyltransferase
VTLRPLQAADAEPMAAAHALAFAAPWSGSEFAGFLAGPGGFGFGVEGDGPELAGFILCRAIAGEAEVLTLAVSPAHRRRGVARALLEAATLAVRATAEAMFLEVADDNVAAIGLYQSAGFQTVGRRRGYYDQADGRRDALVMRRDLNS